MWIVQKSINVNELRKRLYKTIYNDDPRSTAEQFLEFLSNFFF